MDPITIELDVIFFVMGGIAVTTGVIFGAIKFLAKQVGKISKEVAKELIANKESEIKTALETITNELRSFKAEMEDEISAQHRIAIATAKARIDESYSHFINKGSISMSTLATLENVFKEYESRGGNHNATLQMEALRKLPRTKE